MRTKVSGIILFFLFFFGTQDSFAQSTFQKKIHIVDADGAADMKQTLDSGCIITGEAWTYRGPGLLSLIKTDKSGTVVWNKAYRPRDGGNAWGAAVQQTADSGYIAAGYTGQSVGNVSLKQGVYVVKTDAAGALQWSKEIVGKNSSEDIVYSIRQTSDKGYIMAGSTSSYGSLGVGYYGDACSDIYLIKLNASGGVVWSKTFGNANVNEVGYCVRETNDGGYVIAGTMDKTILYNHYACLLKTNASGALQWTQSFALDTVYSNVFKSVEQTTDKGFIIAGDILPGAWLVKTDSLGDLSWNKVYSNNVHADGASLALQTSGGYILGGTAGVETQRSNPMLILTDDSGNVSWAKRYGDGFQGLTSFIPVMGGGYALSGPSGSTITPENNYGRGAYTSGNYVDMFLVKTDANGNTGGCQKTLLPTVTSPVLLVSSDLPASGTGAITAIDPGTVNSDFSVQDSIGCFTTPISVAFSPLNTTTCYVGDSVYFYNYSNASLFHWDFGDSASGLKNSSTLREPRHVYLSMGTYTVTLIAADGDGSSADTISKSFTYSIVPKDFLSAGIDMAICNGDTATLTASGGQSGNNVWDNGYTVGDTIKKNPDTTTTYTVVGYNGTCYDTATVTVSVVSFPNATIGGEDTICTGDSVVLNASGGDGYLWSTGVTVSSITVSPPADSAWWVAVASGACSDTAKISITVLARPVINAGNDVTVNYGSGVALFPSGTGVFHWYPAEGLSCFDCQFPFANPTVSSMYYVSLKDANGCTDSDSVSVFLELPCGDVFVPTSFSPNNDGYNDILYARVRCVKDLDYSVYSRWGEKVFETHEETSGWDGSYKGKPMSSGVFVYSLNAVLEHGEIINKKGNVFLAR